MPDDPESEDLLALAATAAGSHAGPADGSPDRQVPSLMRAHPAPRTRRDRCPGVLRPWQAADGLLVRLRLERIVPLLLHGAAVSGAAYPGAAGHGVSGDGESRADVAVIEGVMGLHDGRLGTGGFASTAHVAALTASPVVLVLDVARLSRTAAAIAAGLAAFNPQVRVAGVVLNRGGSARNEAEIRRAMDRARLPVLGVLPHDESLAAPSRHLGLVPAAERPGSAADIARLGDQVARHLDLDALLAVAGQAPGLDARPWDPRREVRPARHGTPATAAAGGSPRPAVAMAGGRAFTFRYTETEELLRAAGCDVVTFDPLSDTSLPPGTRGIYLGGGFPEVYAAELAANRALLRDLRAAVAGGVPTVAECAGLLYLAQTLDGVPMAGIVPAAAAMSGRLTLRYPEAIAPRDSMLTRAGERVTGHEFHRTRTTPPAGDRPAWEIGGSPAGFTGDSWHASYLHVHWAGHPRLAQRFADAVHATTPATTPHASSAPVAAVTDVPAPVRARAAEPDVTGPSADAGGKRVQAFAAGVARVNGVSSPAGTRAPAAADVGGGAPARPLRHHGDTEAGPGLLDFAVNVYPLDRPAWLDRALHAAIRQSAAYPDAGPARAAIARRHARDRDEVLVTAGAAEAFTLIARLHRWRRPAVVHPQFTEPHAALEQAGRTVTSVVCRADDGFVLDTAAVPEDADLVVIGNPANPTGVLHPAACIRRLCRPGRLVVVDEAFMDAVPGEPDSLIADRDDGLLVIRSLTKHWSIPGIRAGYVVAAPSVIAGLAAAQTPWSVSTVAVAAAVACAGDGAAAEARQRALNLGHWREHLESGLRARDVHFVPSAASFVLARLGAGTREALRTRGVAVRRGDTFPGLDRTWARIAVRPPAMTDRLLLALDQTRPPQSAR